jgi:hypothetical protein
MKFLRPFLCALVLATAAFAADPVVFNARTAGSGNWSHAKTWAGERLPQAGDFVQVRTGHTVTYDVDSGDPLRMVHVAGTLTFSREKSTLLVAGLIRIEPGETTTEGGFDCHSVAPILPVGAARPALEIGTLAAPIPAGITATIRLKHFKGTNTLTLPAIVTCGGRWDVHGAPLKRTWVKLAAPARSGDTALKLEERMNDWRAGDRVIITTGEAAEHNRDSFNQKNQFPRTVGTEERKIAAGHGESPGAALNLDAPLKLGHRVEGLMRCEVANLSRNVVIESAEPAGVRGHTMYHCDSSGGISYAEFRHLGKEGVLGKYPIHFHLVTGASIWDSHNRWLTIHGTDHLLIRDCVGYQSHGHGFYLEDATEQWNVLDRNLAVQAFLSAPMHGQALPFDPNDGAGFWWANGRNTFTRNVACENDNYGYHFEIKKTPGFDPELDVRAPDGKSARRDVRTLPFLRFEDNEAHGDGLYGFRFGDATPGSVQGDRGHPFVVRNLRAWKQHYALRPNVRFFLLEGLRVQAAAFGIYHPDYDAHVYRDVDFHTVTAEPLNGGHDETNVPYGDYTYERLTFSNCALSRDPLIQLTSIASKPDLAGHFRGITLNNSKSNGGMIDFGGGPRTNKVEPAASYYFYDTPKPGVTMRVASGRFSGVAKDAAYRSIDRLTGGDARAIEVSRIPFPELLAPVDDLPPATLITSIRSEGTRRIVRGVSHDNGEIASVTVNGRAATITGQQAGVADWTITLDTPASGRVVATATDKAGNVELLPHELPE